MKKENVMDGNFTIPDNYLQKFESHKSYLDGADIDYYVYSDKIIVDKKTIIL